MDICLSGINQLISLSSQISIVNLLKDMQKIPPYEKFLFIQNFIYRIYVLIA